MGLFDRLKEGLDVTQDDDCDEEEHDGSFDFETVTMIKFASRAARNAVKNDRAQVVADLMMAYARGMTGMLMLSSPEAFGRARVLNALLLAGERGPELVDELGVVCARWMNDRELGTALVGEDPEVKIIAGQDPLPTLEFAREALVTGVRICLEREVKGGKLVKQIHAGMVGVLSRYKYELTRRGVDPYASGLLSRVAPQIKKLASETGTPAERAERIVGVVLDELELRQGVSSAARTAASTAGRAVSTERFENRSTRNPARARTRSRRRSAAARP